jgi:hypothetical protein
VERAHAVSHPAAPLRRSSTSDPGRIPRAIDPRIADEMLDGRVHDLPRNSQALILVDGIDELQDCAPRRAAQ